MYHIGLDVGSTTLKCVVLDKNNEIIFKRYQRHKSFIRELALEYMQEIQNHIGKNAKVNIAVTGSAGMGLAEASDLGFIQEVVATQYAVTQEHKDVDVVIELGGEDAKILFLTGGTEVRMNGSCAGGTGAFIDQMAVLLDMDLEEFDKVALTSERIYPVASRCGVFAKTDIQPLLNQGAHKSDVAMSIYHAVVNQTVGGLAQGREIKGNVMFLGGPLTFQKGLQKAFVDVLELPSENYIFPSNAQYFVALGAALYAKGEPTYSLEEVERRIGESAERYERSASHLTPLFESEDDYQTFLARQNLHQVPRGELKGYTGNAYIGIDAGSTTIKMVVIGENSELLYEMYNNSNGRPIEAVLETLEEIYTINPELKVVSSAVTGYGEELIKSAFRVDHGIVETIAHLTAAKKFLPEVDFIIDIGGQDMKCFKISQGAIDTIYLNEACSSGCGSFISSFATALGYEVGEFAKLGLFAKHPVDLGSRCTVFMNSSVKQAQKEGATISDISAGLSISVVKNALYKVIRVHSAEELGKHVVVQGGTFYNDAILRAFEMELGSEVIRPDIAGLMGAYGCALYAAKQDEETSSILSLAELEKFEHSVDTRTCQLCGNHCQLTINTFSGGRELIAGNRCERPLLKNKPKSAKTYNLYEQKRKWIRQLKAKKPLTNSRGTIGMPLGLNIYEMYPFWSAFWRELKFNVVFSPFGSKSLYLDGQQTIPSDTVCYPAKLMHGHMKYLIDHGIKDIFYPCLTYNFDENISDNHYNCPVVAYYPQVLDANMSELKNVNYYFPFYGVHNKKHFFKSISNDMKKWFGISPRETKRAVQKAFEMQKTYAKEVKAYGAEAIHYAHEHDLPIVVLVGRPYHIDPEINHGIDGLITEFNCVVVTEDALPFDKTDTDTDVLNQWTYHARLYNAAKYVTQHDDMYLIQLVSFGCGLDAITTDEVWDILAQEGDLYTQIKIDEINNLGAVKIRLRSLFAAIDERKKAVTS